MTGLQQPVGREPVLARPPTPDVTSGANRQVKVSVPLSGDRLRDAALAYAAGGRPVLPLVPGEKVPLTGHGLHNATTDPAVIAGWWARWPDANIGLRTGTAFDVLDIDSRDGMDTLVAAMPDGAPAIYGPTVRTGKGWHVYVAPTGRGNRAGIVGPGVDWRGANGFVVAPPSRHPSGRGYRWCAPSWAGPDAPIEPAPDWLLGLLDRPRTMTDPGPGHGHGPIGAGASSRYGRQALDAEVGRLARAPEGQRNDTLHRAAFRCGQLVAGGHLDTGTVVDVLWSVAARIGLGDGEISRTIESGIRSGAAHPRNVRS